MWLWQLLYRLNQYYFEHRDNAILHGQSLQTQFIDNNSSKVRVFHYFFFFLLKRCSEYYFFVSFSGWAFTVGHSRTRKLRRTKTAIISRHRRNSFVFFNWQSWQFGKHTRFVGTWGKQFVCLFVFQLISHFKSRDSPVTTPLIFILFFIFLIYLCIYIYIFFFLFCFSGGSDHWISAVLVWIWTVLRERCFVVVVCVCFVCFVLFCLFVWLFFA